MDDAYLMRNMLLLLICLWSWCDANFDVHTTRSPSPRTQDKEQSSRENNRGAGRKNHTCAYEQRARGFTTSCSASRVAGQQT